MPKQGSNLKAPKKEAEADQTGSVASTSNTGKKFKYLAMYRSFVW